MLNSEDGDTFVFGAGPFGSESRLTVRMETLLFLGPFGSESHK